MERHNKDVGTKEDLMLYRIRTAKENLRSARILLDAQEYKGANNRAYYAIFQAINAVHAIDGTAYKRHKDAIANFNKNYITKAIFPRMLGRKIQNASAIREDSDYDDEFIVDADKTNEQLKTAEELIELVDKYIDEN